jgi:hypothetical protein
VGPYAVRGSQMMDRLAISLPTLTNFGASELGCPRRAMTALCEPPNISEEVPCALGCEGRDGLVHRSASQLQPMTQEVGNS